MNGIPNLNGMIFSNVLYIGTTIPADATVGISELYKSRQGGNPLLFNEIMENKSEIIIYKSEDGTTAISVQLQEETVWLSLMQMTELFQRDKSVISRHIKNIYDEKELVKNSTVANFATVQTEGGRAIERKIEYYSLDVIISVGYRVKSKRGTQFRIWASRILKDYLVKGYAVNEKRLTLEEQIV